MQDQIEEHTAGTHMAAVIRIIFMVGAHCSMVTRPVSRVSFLSPWMESFSVGSSKSHPFLDGPVVMSLLQSVFPLGSTKWVSQGVSPTQLLLNLDAQLMPTFPTSTGDSSDSLNTGEVPNEGSTQVSLCWIPTNKQELELSQQLFVLLAFTG